MTFAVPLGQGTHWENNELRYMLRSLQTHCQFDFDVIVYCTKKLDWLNCKQVEVPRTYPKEVREYFNGAEHYENYYDVINKLRTVIDDEDVGNEFVFIYDDIILLEDYYLADVKKIYSGNNYHNNRKFFDNPKNKWTRTIHAALTTCQAHGYPLYVYETHLPKYFMKNHLREMFSKHKPESNFIPYAISTVYFNMVYKEPTHNYMAKNTIKAGFYGGVMGNDGFSSQSKGDIEEAVNGKLWMNYANRGLTPPLKDWISRKFPVPSRFEKV
jgi:hypothetical protein